MISHIHKCTFYFILSALLILNFKPVFAYADNLDNTIITKPVTGDYDGDGIATSKDYALMKKHLLGQLDHFPAEARTIYTIDDLDYSVFKGDHFDLPKSVTAVMLDDSKRDVPVVWNTSNVDTSRAGIKTIYGMVDGYNNKMILTLNVQDTSSGNEALETAITDANTAIALIPLNITEANLSQAKHLIADAESKIISALEVGADDAELSEFKNILIAKENIKIIEDAMSSGLSLTSVEALNKVQLKMVFNQKVDPATAKNPLNYYLNDINLNYSAYCELQNDGQTVIITAGSTGGFTTNTLTESAGYVLRINGVKNLDKSKIASEIESQPFKFINDIYPTVTTVSAIVSSSSSRIVVKYNEPVKGYGLYLINGIPASGETADYTSNTVTLTSPTMLDVNSQYNLEVINEQDLAGNLTTQIPTLIPFNVTLINTAPTVSINSVGEMIKLKFSRSMDIYTIIGTSNIIIFNEYGVDITKLGVHISVVNDINADGSQYTIKLSADRLYFDQNSKILNFQVVFTQNIRDSLGNRMAATAIPVSLDLDQEAPIIVSGEWVKAGGMYDGYVYAYGALILTLSENVLPVSNLISGSGFIATADNGVVDNNISGFNFQRNKSDDDKKLIFVPSSGCFSGTAWESLHFNSGVFSDTSLYTNTSTSQDVVIDLTHPVNEMPPDTKGPVIGNIYTAQNSIYVDLGETMATLNAATILDPGSYRLNGAALPSGTFISVLPSRPSDIAVIHLPENSIQCTGVYVITVGGIKDKEGNICNPKVGVINLFDNTKPIMKSLVFNLNETMTIGFDEAVTGFTTSDFLIKVNGTNTDQYSVSPGVGVDFGKAIITFNNSIALGSTIEVITSNSPGARDQDGNKIQSGINLSIKK